MHTHIHYNYSVQVMRSLKKKMLERSNFCDGINLTCSVRLKIIYLAEIENFFAKITVNKGKN